MLSRAFFPITTAILFLFLSAGSAQALTMDFGGASDPSLHGATGSLEVTGDIAAGTGTFQVVWSMDFSGYDGSIGDHQYLTDIGFKAFSSVSVVSLDSITWTMLTTGTLIESGKISNAGCEGPSSAGFVCVKDLNPMVDATQGGVFEAIFTVEGDLDLTEWSYRGKFGPEDGWVISENGTPSSSAPEPTAALVYGLGLVAVGYGVRRRDAAVA